MLHSDFIANLSARALIPIINRIPIQIRVGLVTFLLRVTFFLSPKLKIVALKNLALAFPDNASRCMSIWNASIDSMAWALVDSLRLPNLSPEWIREHVKFDRPEEFSRILSDSSSGILLVSGHLSSFELLAYSIPCVFGRRVNVVIRKFSGPLLNEYVLGLRRSSGNLMIDREGAYRGILRALKKNEIVGILFDQNVKRDSAAFVKWFGRKAATTKVVALAHLATTAPIVVLSIQRNGHDSYRAVWALCDTKSILEDSALSKDERILRITEKASNIFQEQILARPEGWFWLHKRWRTVPEGESETFYKR